MKMCKGHLNGRWRRTCRVGEAESPHLVGLSFFYFLFYFNFNFAPYETDSFIHCRNDTEATDCSAMVSSKLKCGVLIM